MINKYENQLINEKSPYLLEHANNPVNWYPWSEEVFEKAKDEDKLVFLSIGYSTCHWCHVMAHESFEDEEVARLLNNNFYCIKVDREERPDIDNVYMDLCVQNNGSGGWPLSVFLKNDKIPIYIGTYFSKDVFINLLKNILFLWKNDRKKLNQYLKIVNSNKNETKKAKEIDENIVNDIHRILSLNYDEEFGGFSSAPKFPMPTSLMFLLKHYECTNNPNSLKMVMNTLDHMRIGGIYDQIGFGFSRYSTDRLWLIPHFEKMLYDNVLLLIVYLECYHIIKDEKYKNVANEIIEYLLRNMLSDEGGLYTAEDADSESEEGKFYVFNPVEIKEVLADDSENFMNFYNITKDGNFEGNSIPNLIGKTLEYSEILKFEKSRKKVFNFQQKRIHPFKDDKILTSYNGLAIAAFSLAYRYMNDEKYLKIAIKIYSFIKGKLYKNNKLLARYRDNEAKYLAYSEDYAYLIYGLNELHQATLEKEYLDFALTLQEIHLEYFFDEINGGFYQNDKKGEVILYRSKEIFDGATPSSNSIAIYNLYRLAYLTDKIEYQELAVKSMEHFMAEIKKYPAGYAYSGINVLYHINGGIMVTLVDKTIDDVMTMKKAIDDCKLPFITIRYQNNSNTFQLLNDKTTAYVCKGFTCLKPINDMERFYEILRS